MSKRIRTAILISVLLLLLATTVGSAFAGPYWWDPPKPPKSNGYSHWLLTPAINADAPWQTCGTAAFIHANITNVTKNECN